MDAFNTMESMDSLDMEREAELLLDENTKKYLTFTIGEESYGIKIESVTQIIGIQPITKIPNQPEYVKGVINLRGQIIPLMEVRTKFMKETIPYDDRTCVVVISKDEIDVGLIVDRVSEVMNIHDDHIADTHNVRKEESHYIQGIANLNEKVVIILDIDELLLHEEAN